MLSLYSIYHQPQKFYFLNIAWIHPFLSPLQELCLSQCHCSFGLLVWSSSWPARSSAAHPQLAPHDTEGFFWAQIQSDPLYHLQCLSLLPKVTGPLLWIRPLLQLLWLFSGLDHASYCGVLSASVPLPKILFPLPCSSPFRTHFKRPASESLLWLPSPVIHGSVCGLSLHGVFPVHYVAIYIYYLLHIGLLLLEAHHFICFCIPNFQQCLNIVGGTE